MLANALGGSRGIQHSSFHLKQCMTCSNAACAYNLWVGHMALQRHSDVDGSWSPQGFRWLHDMVEASGLHKIIKSYGARVYVLVHCIRLPFGPKLKKKLICGSDNDMALNHHNL